MSGFALITGASSGLGLEYARLFARDGHSLVLLARRRERLEEAASELRQHGVRVEVVAADLADPATPERVFEQLTSAGVEVEFLVNNAGFGTRGAFVELERERELELIAVNVTALVHLTRRFLPAMVERGRGAVLNVGSTAGFVPGPHMAVYYASKAFVNSFTEALAHELRGTGVSATAACPGPTATEFAGIAGNDRSVLFRMGAAGAAEVALHGYRAMRSGEPIAVHGLRNKLSVQSLRVSPRSAARHLTAALNQTS